MLKKIVLAAAFAGAMSAPAFAAGEVCIEAEVGANGTTVPVAQCVTLP